MTQEGVDPTRYQQYLRGVPSWYNRSNRDPPHHAAQRTWSLVQERARAGRSEMRLELDWAREGGNGTRRTLDLVPDWGPAEARLEAVIAR